ncbi:C6 zinc finger domain protein [Diplogelasinospora grovesii]|uniref:C6 zinc finger domain protein n=1 Tax=Diplogelasinospora grovesii TaxID=303347 RepID=A0AAN6NB95_9PEZI|nr:C6 zinc finger domain protein [Diplogelasinospora grovesii]
MPPRKGFPKVKTGCRTCKLRKVKCDEVKPHCARCAAAGRQCGGYDEAGVPQGLSWYRPRQLTAHDEKEGRAFQFFSHMIGPVLSGPMDTYFWTHLVMQFSHFEPAVRHAVVAISSLYEDFHGGSRLMRQKCSNAFAISHYYSAIRRAKSTGDEQLILLVCILFICVEYLQGNVQAALRHCQHGRLIINKDSCRSPWAREHLLPIFRRLGFIPFFFGSKVTPPVPDLTGFDTPVPITFTSIAQAQASLDELRAQATRLHRTKDRSQQRSLLLSLDEWHCRLEELEAALSMSSPDELAVCTMRMEYEVSRICISHAFEPSETAFDLHLDNFQLIVDLARRASQLRQYELPEAVMPATSFTFETGFLPLLYFVVIKCRHLQTRLEALAWMTELSAAKESFLDVGTLYRVGHRLVEIEHDICLDDLGSILDITGALLAPSEDKRVLDARVDHEIEPITEANGAVTYRRTVDFFMRDAAGQRFARGEFITDARPRQRPVGLPNMRCARPIIEVCSEAV